MSPRRRLAAALSLAAALLAGVAAAQQPPPQPMPMPPGHPPILPLERTQPAPRPGAQPPQRAPGVQPGRPIGPGGQQFPPGMQRPRPIPQPGAGGRGIAPTPPPPPAPRADECPGHGPMDPPHHPNWWEGIIGVNNEAWEQGGINRLFWRYHNHNNPCDPKNMPPPFLASMLNFGVLAFILFRFGRKPLREALVKRRQTIMQEIDNSNRLKEQAERRLQEYEGKLENLDEMLVALKADYAAQAELERKNLLVELEERRARMRRDAEFRLEQELKEARLLLLQEAVRGAASAAEQLVRKHVSAADQERLAEDYVKAFPSAVSGSGLTGQGAQPGAST